MTTPLAPIVEQGASGADFGQLPILFLDVDGPLNPFAAKPIRRPAGYRMDREHLLRAPAVVAGLARSRPRCGISRVAGAAGVGHHVGA